MEGKAKHLRETGFTNFLEEDVHLATATGGEKILRKPGNRGTAGRWLLRNRGWCIVRAKSILGGAQIGEGSKFKISHEGC